MVGTTGKSRIESAVGHAIEEVGADVDRGIVVTIPAKASALSAVAAANASRRNQCTYTP